MTAGTSIRRALRVALAAAALAVVAVAAAAGVALWTSGLSARPEPSRAEARLARLVRNLVIRFASRGLPENPLPATPEVWREGRGHFADHCASCHGNDGSGNTELGRRLYPRAPDMRLPETQRLGDGELFRIIEHGIRFTGMPGWGGEVPAEDTWKLVHFIRHLPKLGPEEILEMERLNPKTPREWQEMEGDEEFLEGAPAPPAAHGSHAH